VGFACSTFAENPVSQDSADRPEVLVQEH
jgi:hypothetical protein